MVCLIFAYTDYFSSYTCKRKKKKTVNKTEKFMFGFSSIISVSRNVGVNLALEEHEKKFVSFLHSSNSFFCELLQSLMYRQPF